MTWTEEHIDGRLWACRSADDRWYIEHLDTPGTPWAIYYCTDKRATEVMLLPTLKAARECVESGRIVPLVIQTLENRVALAARSVAKHANDERRAADHHENARAMLAGAVADLTLRHAEGPG